MTIRTATVPRDGLEGPHRAGSARRGARGGAGAACGGGVVAERRCLLRTRLRHLRPRRPRSPLRRRAGGEDQADDACRHLDLRRSLRLRRQRVPGARAALDGVRSRLRRIGPALRRLHRQGRRGDPRRRAAGVRGHGRSGDAPQRPHDPSPDLPEPQRRAAPVRARRLPLHRHRRRRRWRRPRRERAGPTARCSARSCGSTPGRAAARPYTVPADNPFVGTTGAPRDLEPRVCATPTASRSTA